jgi:MFS transporter, DHA1 family, multidrug resistance protein
MCCSGFRNSPREKFYYASFSQESGHVLAGTASSFIGSYTTLLGALLGLVIGRSSNGTVIPLSVGYLGLGAACLGIVLWTEKGRLSLRDRRQEGAGDRALPVAAE